MSSFKAAFSDTGWFSALPETLHRPLERGLDRAHERGKLLAGDLELLAIDWSELSICDQALEQLLQGIVFSTGGLLQIEKIAIESDSHEIELSFHSAGKQYTLRSLRTPKHLKGLLMSLLQRALHDQGNGHRLCQVRSSGMEEGYTLTNLRSFAIAVSRGLLAGEPAPDWGDHIPRTTALAFSPCGGFIAIYCYSDVIRVFDITKACWLPEIECWVKNGHMIAYSPCGRYLACVASGSTGRISVLDMSKRELHCSLKSSRKFKKLRFSPSGDQLACGAPFRKREAWDLLDLESKIFIEKDAQGIDWIEEETAFYEFDLPDSQPKLMAVEYDDSDLIDEDKFDQFLSDFAKAVDGVYQNPPMIFGFRNGNTHLRVEHGRISVSRDDQEFFSHDLGEFIDVKAVAINTGGEHVAAATRGNDFGIWETATGRRLTNIKFEGAVANVVQFSPCGRLVLTGSIEGDFWLFDVVSGEVCYPFSYDPQTLKDWVVEASAD